MNRKLLSLVLAAVFTVSLGVTKILAAYSDYESTAYTSKNAQTYTVTNEEGDITKHEGVFIKVGTPQDELSGKLTGTFSYYAGVMVGYIQAGGNYTIYDSYGARAVLTNAGGETFSLQNFVFRTSDLASMPEGNASIAEWKSYLKNLGFSEGQLSRMEFNNDGQVVNESGNAIMDSDNTKAADQEISLSLFKIIRDELSKGVNYSVSMAAGDGSTGPTITVSENGKQMASYTSADGYTETIGGNSYSGVRQTAKYNYDSNGLLCSIDQWALEITSSDENGVYGTWKKTRTEITYDSAGVRTDSAYKINDDNSRELTSVTKYTANNSTMFTTDMTTGNITYYADNKQTVTYNTDHAKVAKYDYTDNGRIRAYYNAQGTGPDGETVGTTTVFDKWQRNRGTVVGEYLGASDSASALAAVNRRAADIVNGNYKKYADGSIEAKVTTVELYQQDIKNGVDSHLLSANDVSSINKFKNGYSSIASISITDSNWGDGEAPENAVNASNLTATTTNTTVIDTNAGYNGYKYNAEKSAAATNTTSTGYTLNTTVKLGGASAYQTKCNIVTGTQTNNVSVLDDPAVTGTFLGTTVIDGRTYAMIGNAEMNVLDGSGFQAVEGETVYVDITGNENMISAAQGEEVMFMGDVAQSTNGNLTIAMNVNYGGGFVSGSAEISAMKAEITQVSQTVSMARDALELGEITQAEYDSIIENSGWIGTNTAANLEKFANGNFSWDENKTALENLRDAFDILLNF